PAHRAPCPLGVPPRPLDLLSLPPAPAGAEPAISEESLDLRWWPIDAAPAEDTGLTQLLASARNRLGG
ncbi:MAG: NUDIX hydrolase, partial [Mycobacterium sp.]|nr:NUDIX hydrolase [Mycobacterium sp.]